LASGLYGIEHKLELQQPPVQGNAYRAEGCAPLPTSLLEATERMAGSAVASALFGEAFVEHFVQTRLWEWRQFQKAVTSWELERYLEII
jgi:glutamine synthetase